ncbi:hypothetical protein [Noviherbaspirillum aridicola]|uniref:Uncharacterized protein n=1 Tax=Noviherbaspirillum aridicola TaxID=2849687 RepID=A0ABQ4Q1M1_9BURK|nr:hypothetical protein [Noviherbaspirillum aridicola]GIZ50695.1 hypothetical protein NCCP691_07090 [Noviherbaspirillum aridicola]
MRRLLPALLALACGAAAGQALDARFACSSERNEDGEKVVYTDVATMRLKGDRIEAFSWESALHRSTHGFDCSIDDSDGLSAEVSEDGARATWRVALRDARAARDARGYTFDRRMNCTIRLVREGDSLQVKPTCPALCGSRPNFTELSVDLKTGKCRHEE